METARFAYTLPPERIAQAPASPRESAKLFVYDRASGTRRHLTVRDLPSLVNAGDVAVVNVASVRRTRLFGTLERTGRTQEVFLLRPGGKDGSWEAFLRGRIHVGDRTRLAEGVTAAVQTPADDGAWWIVLSLSPADLPAYLERHGSVPLPPYLRSSSAAPEYETAFADAAERRSVAAPTAGFHLTEPLLAEMRSRGTTIERVVLDVGRGTFRPITADRLEDHVMHAERAKISPETATALTEALRVGKRIVAVGTTTTRALESAFRDGTVQSFEGETSLFITPGFSFHVVGALLTNFHLPRSSLLALVSAFIGSVDVTLDLYKEAIAREYRFYSFGDAMLVL